jgi:hypothetical protein
MEERRANRRLRTLKGGSILYGTAPAVECVIRNMTDAGACLEVATPAGIPNRFNLLIKPEMLTRPCHVAWRSADRIGVRFQP